MHATVAARHDITGRNPEPDIGRLSVRDEMAVNDAIAADLYPLNAVVAPRRMNTHADTNSARDALDDRDIVPRLPHVFLNRNHPRTAADELNAAFVQHFD